LECLPVPGAASDASVSRHGDVGRPDAIGPTGTPEQHRLGDINAEEPALLIVLGDQLNV
jgi:hypothetical protein